jgi:2'-5' RNA ligase
MLQPLGWEPEDRPFRAHLTVGRVKRKHRQIALPWGKGVLPRPVPVDAVHLMESRLRPGGPIYTVLHSSKLGS